MINNTKISSVIILLSNRTSNARECPVYKGFQIFSLFELVICPSVNVQKISVTSTTQKAIIKSLNLFTSYSTIHQMLFPVKPMKKGSPEDSSSPNVQCILKLSVHKN